MAKAGVGVGVNIKSNGTQNKTTKQNKNKTDSETGEGGEDQPTYGACKFSAGHKSKLHPGNKRALNEGGVYTPEGLHCLWRLCGLRGLESGGLESRNLVADASRAWGFRASDFGILDVDLHSPVLRRDTKDAIFVLHCFGKHAPIHRGGGNGLHGWFCKQTETKQK